MQDSYIYKKEVDWSLLVDGFTIPISNQVVFAKTMGKFLGRGEKKNINIILKGITYKARIVNVNFNKTKYKRKDIYQVRYSKGSDLANVLRNIFYKSHQYILEQRNLRLENDRGMIKVPSTEKEYLVLYTTVYEDTYIADVITADDSSFIRESMGSQDELVFENSINYRVTDPTADLVTNEKFVKIRKLDRAIGENLKMLYNYRCQICGKDIGSRYGQEIVEAHHIDYYVSSMNNDADNQLIVCPSHHRVIHSANPVFQRNNKIYKYENGLEEGLLINYHL